MQFSCESTNQEAEQNLAELSQMAALMTIWQGLFTSPTHFILPLSLLRFSLLVINALQ